MLLILAAVVLIVSAPLRRGIPPRADAAGDGEIADLEAARDAKYREIRDAELDLATGKLSEFDHRAIDAALRTEAIDILRRLDHAREREAEPDA